MNPSEKSSTQSFGLYNEWTKPEVTETKWKHIFKSNAIEIKYRDSEDSNHELLAFKYMPYSRLKSSLDNNEFVFVSPTKWRDPFEKLLFKENGVLNNNKYEVTAACFAQNDFKNEEGLWHFAPFASNDNSNPTVRVAFKMKELLGQLDQYANSNILYDFYLSMVQYIESPEIIKRVKRECNNYTIEDYINDLSLKRVAFSHEIELRLFCVENLSGNQDATRHQEEPKGITKIKVQNMKGIISHVTLPPIEPMFHGCRLARECYHKALVNSNSVIRDELKKKEIDVRYSSLYDVLEIENKIN